MLRSTMLEPKDKPRYNEKETMVELNVNHCGTNYFL